MTQDAEGASEATLPLFHVPLRPGERHRRLRELAGLFLKLGALAFGGPAAHIAMMDHEVVQRRQWLTRQQFLDLVGATNLINYRLCDCVDNISIGALKWITYLRWSVRVLRQPEDDIGPYGVYGAVTR